MAPCVYFLVEENKYIFVVLLIFLSVQGKEVSCSTMAEDDPMQLYQKFTESFNKIARPEENGED